LKLSDREQALVQAMSEWEIIDCHEHLGPEEKRIQTKVDVFTLFSHYTRGDLCVAGMTETDYNQLYNQDIPLNTRWRIFAPYWEQIRYGSYARAALLAARKFYGAEDICEGTYSTLSTNMKAANVPGLYEKVLKDACKIRTCLTQCGSTSLGNTPLLTPVMPMVYETETWRALHHPPFTPTTCVESLDQYIDSIQGYILQVKSEGAVGLKMISNPFEPADRKEALRAFSSLVQGKTDRLPVPNALRNYVLDQAISFAALQNMVVCVHTGYWGDFRTLDPLHMIPLLQRHPKARFDIYHLGYPWLREAIMLGKGFPNVWLNLCWTHIISQRFVLIGLDELIDTVPMNKILAFGGDYGLPVEKVYGHLVMAREDIARVLARRIEDGDMTEAQALALAEAWFVKNPLSLYQLLER